MPFFKRGPSKGPTTRSGEAKILFVDDEEGNLFVAKEMLADQPYEVLTAADGETALRLLEKEPIAVLVSDQRMPGMTGVDLLHRAAERWPETVRLLLTGFADLGAVVEAINRANIWRYLTKPIDATDLQHAIRLAVQQYLARRAHEREVAGLRGSIAELEQQISERDRRIAELSARKT